MQNFPDFSEHCFTVHKELGHNRVGGRVTYLATDTRTNQEVVIKQFQFARLGANWTDFDAYEREIRLLKELNHPGIPRYLSSFQTEDGFCMVQEYKPATSLAESRSFAPDRIRQIAIAALEILVYLQNRIPPVIHRDIKPANILVDEVGNLFLVDFGFAHIGEGEVGVSSVVKGTLGFMPPEQLFNRQLTEASDLYGLGMTLICLLTDTKSDRIGDLVDISYRVSFKHLVPKLNQHWVNWLEKMVEPRSKDRFTNAVEALAALPASPLRPPEAQFSHSKLELSARHPGEQLACPVQITNPVPDTLLQGEWRLEPHPSDPSMQLYQWITVSPATFADNQIECQVHVDTRRLVPGKIYHRRLQLYANTLAKVYSLDLQIKTVPVRSPTRPVPYALLLLLGLFAAGLSSLLTWVSVVLGIVTQTGGLSGFGTLLGAAIGLELASWLLRSSDSRVGSVATTLAAIVLGAWGLLGGLTGSVNSAATILLEAVIGGIGGAIVGIGLGLFVERLLVQGLPKQGAIAIALLTTILGVSLGVNFSLSFSVPVLSGLAIGSSLLLLLLIVQAQLQQTTTNLTRRQTERHLIKP